MNLLNRLMPGQKSGSMQFTLYQAMSPAHRQRVHETALFWQYYNGHQRPPLKKTANQPDYNLLTNWSRRIVNSSVDLLFSPGLSFVVDDNPAAQAVVDAAWKTNPETGFNFELFLHELGQSGANGRNAFIKLSDSGQKIVNPDMVEIITDDMDMDTVLEYRILWQSGITVFRQVIRHVDAEVWDVFSERFTGGNGWVLEGEVTQWLYSFPPMFHTKNLPLAHSIWGQSDLEDFNLQDAINRINSDNNKILSYNAKPQGFAKGIMKKDAIDAAPGQFIGLPPDGELGYLEMSSDMEANRAIAQQVVSDYHLITGTSSLEPEKISGGVFSGFAMKILMGEAINKAKRKRGTYGGLFQQVNHAILSIAGFPDTAVKNVWGNMIPENETELVQNMVGLVNAGISPLSAAEFLGVEPEMAKRLSATAVTFPILSPIEQVLNGG